MVNTDQVDPDAEIRKAKEALRSGDLLEAWRLASSVASLREDAAAMAGAVARRMTGQMRAAAREGRHGDTLALGSAMLEAGTNVPEAWSALSSAASDSLDPRSRLSLFAGLAAKRPADVEPWRQIAGLLPLCDPDEELAELGFETLRRFPGDRATVEAVDRIVAALHGISATH